MAVLRIIRDGKELSRQELLDQAIIGREEGCTVRLEDHNVSRKHCRLERKPDGWIAIDLRSRNGTLVDGKPISEHPLKHGDVLRIGAASLQFVADNAPLLDDEVLELLNEPNADSDVTEAINDDTTQGVALGRSADAAASAVQPPAQVEPTPAASAPAASRTAQGVSPDARTRSPGRKQVSLWDLASGTAGAVRKSKARTSASSAPPERPKPSIAVASKRRSGKPNPTAETRPWYWQRIPLPAAVGASALALIVLWFVVFGFPRFGFGSGSAAVPKHLPHSSTSNND